MAIKKCLTDTLYHVAIALISLNGQWLLNNWRMPDKITQHISKTSL